MTLVDEFNQMSRSDRPGAHFRLPATSANLGPGFDAAGLAMALYLTVEAEVADAFRIDATGRDAELCGILENNLILTTYVDVLASCGILAPRLHLRLHNEIPLGMGCGSSASALLAGVLLADHFGALTWSRQEILDEACRREGHPDNVAACLLGGMTVSAMTDGGKAGQDGRSAAAAAGSSRIGESTSSAGGVVPAAKGSAGAAGSVVTATFGLELGWTLLLALPRAGLATAKARALLPSTYSREDAVANVQSTALLVAAFAQNRPELLRVAMRDRLHQPYRMEACALLPLLLPLADTFPGVYGVALSGAGPSVLLIAEQAAVAELIPTIQRASGEANLEVIETRISGGAMVGV